MTCTDSTVKEPAHDAGGGRLMATTRHPGRVANPCARNVPGRDSYGSDGLARTLVEEASRSSLPLPVLLMAGALSWADVRARTAALQQVLPHAETVTWAGQSHFANMIAPRLLVETLRDFLEQHPVPAAGLVS
jgi:pimeloyl-ACP methyl ester carboxylesterase